MKWVVVGEDVPLIISGWKLPHFTMTPIPPIAYVRRHFLAGRSCHSSFLCLSFPFQRPQNNGHFEFYGVIASIIYMIIKIFFQIRTYG